MGTTAVDRKVLNELVGPLPTSVYWAQGAVSYFGMARMVWKKLENVELIAQYHEQKKIGILGNAMLNVAKDFIPAVGVASSAMGFGDGKQMLQCEYMLVSVLNCTEQSNRFYSSLRALKDALSLNRQMPPRLENKLNSVRLAAEEGLAKKVTWLFSPSSMVWTSNKMIILAWRVGQMVESLFWVFIDGFKLSMFCMDVMEAYHFTEETRRAIADNESVYAAILVDKGNALLSNGETLATHVMDYMAKDSSVQLTSTAIHKVKEKIFMSSARTI